MWRFASGSWLGSSLRVRAFPCCAPRFLHRLHIRARPCNIHGSIPMGGAMQRNRYLLAIAACASALVGLPAAAPTPEVTLTRLDCGTDAAPRDVARFSDTFAYRDLKLPFTFSCYLIKHGDEYMVWDTGFVPGSNPNAPKVSL